VAKAAVPARLRRLLPAAGRLGGVLLVLSGGYLIAYWLPALSGATPARPDAGLTEAVSARLTGFLDGHQTLLAGLTGVVLAAGTATAVLVRRRATHPDPVASDSDCCTLPAQSHTEPT
jgi:hypothetical protein